MPHVSPGYGNNDIEVRIDSLPDHVKASYEKYSKGGWKGIRPNQTRGTKAGGIYQNDNNRLPTTGSNGNVIIYKEYDVNNKLLGQVRDVERFVIGSNGSKYYTKDHYNTFIRIGD